MDNKIDYLYEEPEVVHFFDRRLLDDVVDSDVKGLEHYEIALDLRFFMC